MNSFSFSINTHTQTVNEDIEITAVSFRPQRSSHELESFPRRMLWAGREYDFVEMGMQYLVQKGQHIVRLFDVSDGFANYRLRFDPDEHRWTLLSIKDAPQLAY